MVKKYKHVLFVAIMLALFLFLTVNIKCAIDLQKAIMACSELDDYRVTVKDYASGKQEEISNSDKKEIVEQFSEIKYRGVLLNSDPISEEQAVNMRCSEAIGYAAKAFYIKYITGSDPSLPLPASGPVY